ncbi:putative phospholipase B-like 2 [Watersipora subatra]|uniref:putative phospholipase B-like 2 n=1 Tax=Watersipora subatra TaxID=2589382 RepID=UPI00355C6819
MALAKMFYIFLAIFIACGLQLIVADDKIHTVSVAFDEETARYTFHDGYLQSGRIAEAEFQDLRLTYGLTFLTVSTNESYPDHVQAYAAGLAEGYITREITRQHWNNTIAGYCDMDSPSDYCKRLHNYLELNVNGFVNQAIIAHGGTDPYWHQVELFLTQVNGFQDGHENTPTVPTFLVRPFGALMFQISGDLEDLEVALNKTESERKRIFGSGSCSALIKLLPGNKELFVSQDTWNGYNSMLRIMKRYLFGYHMLAAPGSPLIPGNEMLFSSYPGYLFSGDDFYIVGSGLVVQETTIGNSNPDLNKYIQPENTVLEGIRNQVANRLATDGASWARIFQDYNSGTYNNEWMIVDYNKFTPGQAELSKGLLTVLEQLPGMIVWDDVTPILAKQTYWASYNSPYFPKIFNASGTQALVDKYGDWFTYDNTPRAKIFRRDHVKVTDIKSMQKLMRYNDFQNDPLSKCNCTPPYSAENAISARSDLNPANGTYPFSALGHRSHGGTDCKITSLALYKQFMMEVVSGPTHDDQKPFSWSTADFADSVPHEGHPDTFDFGPVQTNW